MERDHGRASEPGLGLPRGLRLYAWLIAVLTAIPLLLLLRLYRRGIPLYYARQWSAPDERFSDFWHYRQLFRVFHQAAFFQARDRFAYPAPCAVLYQALYHLGSHPHVIFNLMLWAVEGASALLLLRAMARSGLRVAPAAGLALLMTLTSYPWYTLYDRGNLELFVYVLISLGVWAWWADRPLLSAALWGAAGSLKIYPLLLLAMYLRKRDWRAFLVGVGSCAGILLLSFAYVGPTISIAARGTGDGVAGFAGNYAANARRTELLLDHSLLGCLKETLSLPRLHMGEHWRRLSSIYEVAVVLLGTPLYFLRVRRLPSLNQLCLLLLGIMLLPPVSYDYTLIYAYLILGVIFCAYLRSMRQAEPFPAVLPFMVCFALLSTSQTWMRYNALLPNGMIKCGALVVLAMLLLRFPLRMSQSHRSIETI